MKNDILAALESAREGLTQLIQNQAAIGNIERAARLLVDAYRRGNKAISCGNGGSMSDAMHFAEELLSRFRKNRMPLPALAISDPSYLSCTANDFGYDEAFARFVTGMGKTGDVLVAFSTSGRSENVLRAARAAKATGMSVIALTGRSDAPLGLLADIHLPTPAGTFADRVQELHIKVVHILVECVERELFPELYA